MKRQTVDLQKLFDQHDAAPETSDNVPFSIKIGDDPAEDDPVPSDNVLSPPKSAVTTLTDALKEQKRGVFIPIGLPDGETADPLILSGTGDFVVAEATELTDLPSDISLSIIGTVNISAYDDDKNLAKDHLIKYATILGLHANIQKQTDDGPGRTVWTNRRISTQAALDTITHHPGINRDELAEKLFNPETTIWAQEVRNASTLKTNALVSKLSARGMIVKRYDIAGKLILFAPSDPLAKRFATAPSGMTEIDKQSDDIHAPISFGMAASGAAVLAASRSHGVDLAAQVYEAMWHYKNDTRHLRIDPDDLVISDEMKEAGALAIASFGLRGTDLARAVYGVMYFHIGDLK